MAEATKPVRANSAPAVPEEKKAEEPQTFAPRGLDTSSGKFVKHIPMEHFSARLIRKEQWESIGIFDQGSVEWNPSNDFMLPVEMFNDKALDYLEHRDDGFEIIETKR